MMTIADIIALAKQGYKPGDIKELIELAKTVPEPESEPEKKEPEKKEPEKKEPESEPEKKKPEFDYAAEIEKLKQENEKIKTDLAAAQAENRRASNPETETESDEDALKDIVVSFMR